MKQRFSKRTRLVSALLTLAMVFTFLPLSALAANTASTEIDFNSPDFALEFPDAEFRRFLRDCCDTNYDGKLDVDIKSMTIPTSYEIKSLKGIQLFEALEKLDCHGIGLTTLNVSMNFKLKELDCSGNQLKEYLPILSSGLKKLNCSNNKLTHMNLGIRSGLNLEEVNCSNNNITNIVMDSVGELVKFDCSNNDLMTLDVSQCFKLEELNCSGNQLMELNVSNQTQLTQLDCSKNKLTELNVKQNGSLTSLICNDNQLTTLDLSQNHSLSNLNCAKNRLACLDVTGISGTITADGSRRPIAVRTDGTFDLTTLPGFDVSKATNWNGGSVSGTTLSVNAGADEVSYQYNCGNGVNPTFIFETSLPINEDNFPDPNFRDYIKTYKASGRDVLTVEQQKNVTTIEINNKGVSDLKGIEAFPNLTELDCGNNPGDCDGQSGYGVSKLDSIVEEVVRQIFAQFREVSRKKLLESVKTNDAARIQKKVKKIQKDLENKQKELDDLKAETILVIRGVSALDKELLGTLVAEAREALETLEKQLVQAQEEYEEATKTAKRSNYICNELFTWADVYDTANHDERRAILQQFIKEIRVRKDYEISITLNASFNQVEQLKAVSTYDGAEIFEGISEKGA